MFEDIFNLRLKRTSGQAFGFYIVFFLLGLLLSVILGSLFAIDFDEGYIIGSILGLIYCPIIAFLILNAKKLNKFGLIIVALLSIPLALGGTFLGLIPAAYLTTLEPK